MVEASADARFDEDILRQLSAKFPTKVISALANYSEPVSTGTDQVKAAWAILKKYMESRGHRGVYMLNGSEAQMVREYVLRASEGTTVMGGSYQDIIVAKGGEVYHSQTTTRCVTKGGEETIIPNYPVPPIVATHVRKPGQDQIDAVVCSHFDIIKGTLSLICDLKTKNAIWGLDGTMRVTGLESLKPLISVILKSGARWESIEEQKETLKGKQFFDYWQDCVNEMDMPAWFQLTTRYAEKCINGVKTVTKDDKTGYIIKPEVKEFVALVTPKEYPEHLPHLKAFAKAQMRQPLLVTQNIKAPQMWEATEPTSVSAIVRAKILDSLWGGGKRGFGAIAKNANFGPRMNKVWRELNILAAMVERAKGDLDEPEGEQRPPQDSNSSNVPTPAEKSLNKKKRKGKGAAGQGNTSNTDSDTEKPAPPKKKLTGIDIKCGASTVIAMLTWAEVQGDERIKILVTDEVKNSLFTVPKARQVWLTNMRRPNAILVAVDVAGQLPTFKKADKGELRTQLNAFYERWRFSVTDECMMTYTCVFHDNFFRDFSVEPFGYGHEAKAIISNYGRGKAISAKEWWAKILADGELMNSWWHAPVPMYHAEGVAFMLPSSRVSYNSAVGFTYIEVAPTIQVKKKEAEIEGLDELEGDDLDEEDEEGPADEEGAVVEGIDLSDLLFG